MSFIKIFMFATIYFYYCTWLIVTGRRLLALHLLLSVNAQHWVKRRPLIAHSVVKEGKKCCSLKLCFNINRLRSMYLGLFNAVLIKMAYFYLNHITNQWKYSFSHDCLFTLFTLKEKNCLYIRDRTRVANILCLHFTTELLRHKYFYPTHMESANPIILEFGMLLHWETFSP